MRSAAHKVWVTRSEPGAGRLARALEEAGYKVLQAPVLNIEPLDCSTPTEPATVVVVLSEHAASRYVASKLAARAADTPHIAVGPRTGAYLEQHGLTVTVPSHATSEGLLEMAELRTLQAGDCVWIACGVGGRDLLEATLRCRCTVHRLELYRRIAVERLDACLVSVDTIVASSAAALQTVHELWPGDSDVLIVTPSHRVAQAAHALGFTNVRVADGAGPAAVERSLRAE